MYNKVLGGNYMMRSTTFLMQDASPPPKRPDKLRAFFESWRVTGSISIGFQKSNTFCQRGLKCHLNFDSGSQETCACTEYREGIESKSFLLKKIWNIIVADKTSLFIVTL